MTRRVVCLVLIAACVLTQAVLCAFADESVAPVRYELEIFAHIEAQALTVRQTVSTLNSTGQRLDRLMFSMPANCFRRESTLPYDNATLESAFPAGYAPGGIEFSRILVNGEAAEWAVQGENECFLRVACDLAPGQAAEITLEYNLLITENCAFLGVSEEEWRLTQFYPALCVFEDGDFVTCPLSRAGEWSYQALSDFSAAITLPSDYEIAAPGQVTRQELAGGFTRYTVSLSSARSLALALSRRFHSVSGQTALGTQLALYGQSRSALRRACQEAERTLNALEARFGALPYGRIVIVDAHTVRSLGASGALFLAHEAWEDSDALDAEIRYQLARQYFQELVHVNPTLSPWLFEALSEYTALITVRDTQGEAAFARALDNALRPALQITVPGGYAVSAFAPLFSTQREYEIVVRERGAAVLNELRKAMGMDAFLSALSLYVENNRLALADAQDFALALAQATGRDWDDALLAWLYTIDDYTLQTLDYYE